MIPPSLLKTILKEDFSLDQKQIKQYQDKAKRAGVAFERYLSDETIVDEKTLYANISKRLDIPLIDLNAEDIQKDVLSLIPAPLAETHDIVAFAKTNTEISLAVLDPTDIQTIAFIEKKTGLTATIHLTRPAQLRQALHRYHDDLSKELNIPELTESESRDPAMLKRVAEELPIINIVNSILEHAIFEGASDIHIEPTENDVVVRYRVDGILHQMMSLPKTVKSGIAARIKILASLKIDEHMVPQDGRFKIKLQDDQFAFRVSVIPVYDGEKIVMRLLNEGQKALKLDELGFLPDAKKLVEESTKKPHGMILVTGPTGSGKTTTLYSLLGMLNQPGVNICTIEDPIEYHVRGINQSQINPKAGFTFAGGLRAFLRQDPDIIMVGEIRDQETAEIAIHAAMTGHLVLSTLHTNDAPTTLPRLTDMDIPPFLVAFTTNIIIAQRLVRKLCGDCKQEVTLDKKQIDELEKLLGKKSILDLFEKQKIALPAKEKLLDHMTFFHSVGCTRCGNKGFKGRLGIYEVLDVNANIESLINQRATAEQIKVQAIANGMVTMLEDGIIKAKQGITTIEEVLRVTRD